MKPTVIFYESNYFRFYGAGMVLLWTLEHLQRIRPVFVTTGEGELTQRVREAGIETVVLPTAEVWRKAQGKKGLSGKAQKALLAPVLAPHIGSLARLIRTRDAIGIHANSTRAAAPAGMAARLAGVPMWWHLRRARPLRRNEKIAYTLADRVICISHGVKQTLGDPPKAVVIHDGIPEDRLTYGASGKALKTRLAWPDDALVIGAAASLAPNKRHDLFIRMALTLADEFPHARFLIAGHRPEGAPEDYETFLHQLAAPLEADGRLAFLNWMEEMSEVFAAMAIFVLPSDNEGLGLVAIEAMQMGVAVVRTNTAGAEDMIQEGESGFITPIGDLDALTDRVRQLAADGNLRQRMGQAGMAQARLRFSARRMADQIETLLLSRARS